MKEIKIVNSALDGVPEILLIGELGGYDAASLMENLQSVQAPLVRVRINSYGGDVNAAHAIVSAMHAYYEQGGEIETINEAMAGSAAGWIFAFGTRGKRKILQFAQLFLHQPRFSDGQGIDDLPEGDSRRADLEQCYNGLVGIFTSATELSDGEVRHLMDNDSYISADDAVAMGFADEIVEISNAPKLKSNLTPRQIVNATTALNIDFALDGEGDNKNTENMKEVAKILNLAEGADEKEVANAVEAVQKERDELKEESERLKKESERLKELEKENEALKEEKANTAQKEVENAVDALIVKNDALKDRRDSMIAMAKAGGIENLQGVCASAVVRPEQIDNNIAEGVEQPDSREALAKEFAQMSMSAREELKNSDKAKYSQMVKAYDAIN